MKELQIFRSPLTLVSLAVALVLAGGCIYKKRRQTRAVNATACACRRAEGTAAGPVQQGVKATEKSVGLTVWVHGTVGSSFSLGGLVQYQASEVPDESRLGKFMHNFRNQPILHYDQVLGAEGFDIFDAGKYDATTASSEAACYVLPAYCDVAQAAKTDCEIEQHAIFGWSGFLSQRARRTAGMQLYDALVAYRDQSRKTYGVEPRIRIIAHSHGGNVVLWLADIEKEQKRGLAIDLLFMYGTPMQVETAPCITSPFFKRIYLGYSRGDSIQRRDYFSTSRHKSFMRMSDVADLCTFLHEHPDCMRADVGLLIAGNDKRVSHTNMWLLGRSVPIFAFMDPLPLAVLTPLIIAAIDDAEGKDDVTLCTHFKADLMAKKKRCWVVLLSCVDRPCRHQGVHKRRFEHEVSRTKLRTCAREVYQRLRFWSKRMMLEWRPLDPSRDVIFNLKNYRAITGAFHAL